MTDVVMERRIAAPRPVVFEYLVEPIKLVQWLGVVVDIEPTAGGKFLVDMTGVDVVNGQFVEIVPHERVVFTWGWVDNPSVPPGSSTVTIELADLGAETQLVLTHSGLPEPAVDPHAAGWSYFLPRLEVAGAGGDPGPVEPDRIGEESP